MGAPLLEVRSLSYGHFAHKPLGRNLSFTLENDSILYIEGPNGSGKSSLLRVLLGQRAPLGGTVFWGIEKKRISYIPQLQNTDFHLPVTLADLLRVSYPGHWENSKALKWGLLSETQLDLAWNSASGGERKRTLLTRALLNDSAVLVLDEPMNHLDQESRQLIQSALQNCSASMIVVSHDEQETLQSKKKVQRLLLGENHE